MPPILVELIDGEPILGGDAISVADLLHDPKLRAASPPTAAEIQDVLLRIEEVVHAKAPASEAVRPRIP